MDKVKKKAFISVPMKGRTQERILESIERMKKVAQAYVGEEVELEFVNTIVQDKPPYDCDIEALWYLGQALAIESTCDVFVGLEDVETINGCFIEQEAAKRYGLDLILLKNEYILYGTLDEIEPTSDDEWE